jgi:branched-chain amino acid transport system ATP-binding protein
MSGGLKVENAQAWYGGAQALYGVDLSVGEGEVVALMGRNGMGKTTTVRTLFRMMSRFSGRITFDGHDLATLPAHKAAHLGLGLVPEGRRCFKGLTVEENLTVAARPGHWDAARVFGLFPRLEERLSQASETLWGGEQQMLAIGRALMTNPKLLVLDEATEGLAPVVRQEIWAALRQLVGTGLSILVIDKSLAELTAVAHRCVILEKGQTVWAGPPADFTTDIRDRYLGV